MNNQTVGPSTLRSVWVHSKTEARASNGMVTARHPLAAEAGCQILREGGNAVDAVVAASFAASVVQPAANTIGGGGVLITHDPLSGSAAIDYRYQAPERSEADMFSLDHAAPLGGLFGWSGVAHRANEFGHLAVAVPGSVAGLAQAMTRFGSRPLSEVIAPAIRLAVEGFEMDWYGSLMQGAHLDLLSRFPVTARLFLRDGHFPYRPRLVGPGDVHHQPELARTLTDIAVSGPAAFYAGRNAEAFVREMESGGGIVGARDLIEYQPRESEPRELTYRGYRVLGPKNMSIYIQLIQLLEELDLRGLAPMDPKRIHLVAEVLRRARRDQLLFYGDEAYVDSPWSELSSRQYARRLAETIDTAQRTQIPVAVWPDYKRDDTTAYDVQPHQAEHTVHISAADGSGMMASLTETVLGEFGSGVTTEAGVLLNNGMSGFNPQPHHPNSIAPGKRPVSFMSPLIVLRRDRTPFLTIGASGGRKISGAVVQVLSLVIDCGLGLQEAISTPRIDLEGEALLLDTRFPHNAQRDLESMGHPIVRRSEDLSTFEFSNPGGILREADGKLFGGANPFQATAAVGF